VQQHLAQSQAGAIQRGSAGGPRDAAEHGKESLQCRFSRCWIALCFQLLPGTIAFLAQRSADVVGTTAGQLGQVLTDPGIRADFESRIVWRRYQVAGEGAIEQTAAGAQVLSEPALSLPAGRHLGIELQQPAPVLAAVGWWQRHAQRAVLV